MSKDEQLESLRTQHAKLKDEISDEYATPHPDEQRIAQLKYEKLSVKDQIASLERA